VIVFGRWKNDYDEDGEKFRVRQAKPIVRAEQLRHRPPRHKPPSRACGQGSGRTDRNQSRALSIPSAVPRLWLVNRKREARSPHSQSTRDMSRFRSVSPK
jgi:hypothetical protein